MGGAVPQSEILCVGKTRVRERLYFRQIFDPMAPLGRVLQSAAVRTGISRQPRVRNRTRTGLGIGRGDSRRREPSRACDTRSGITWQSGNGISDPGTHTEATRPNPAGPGRRCSGHHFSTAANPPRKPRSAGQNTASGPHTDRARPQHREKAGAAARHLRADPATASSGSEIEAPGTARSDHWSGWISLQAFHPGHHGLCSNANSPGTGSTGAAAGSVRGTTTHRLPRPVTPLRNRSGHEPGWLARDASVLRLRTAGTDAPGRESAAVIAVNPGSEAAQVPAATIGGITTADLFVKNSSTVTSVTAGR